MFPSSDEIRFLWWFIQGSTMNPSTRDRLRKAWRLCERHAWLWMGRRWKVLLSIMDEAMTSVKKQCRVR
jgi:hypothetical protein